MKSTKEFIDSEGGRKKFFAPVKNDASSHQKGKKTRQQRQPHNEQSSPFSCEETSPTYTHQVTQVSISSFNQIKFVMPTLLQDSQALETQKFLLAKALWIRNLMFDDNLVYNRDCPKEINLATLETKLEVILSGFKKMFHF
jgi:hypothetical protein